MFLKWLVPGVVTVVGGTAIALAATGPELESDLAARARAALGPGAEWAAVRFDGRDAVLTGTAPDRAAADDAAEALAAVPEIRTVDSRVSVAQAVSPYPFVASIESGVMTLSGGYPNAAVHRALLDAAGTGAADHTELLAGAADADGFLAAATFALDAARQLGQGSAGLSDRTLSVSGTARTTRAYEDLVNLPGRAPAGVTIAAITVIPPAASPYVWHARFDGARLTIAGDSPDPSLADQLRTAVPPSIAVEVDLQPASGAPSGFSANALALLKSLLLLESGEASISDGTLTLDGVPATAEIADEARGAVTAIGGIATLEAPHIAEYALSLVKSAGGLAVSGSVPDKATRDRLGSLAGADVSQLTVVRGAPAHFADALQYALTAMGRVTEGQLDLKGTRLSLGGRAATLDDFRALNAMLEQPPEGFTALAGALHPPIVAPYTWTARKAADGTISFSGHVPDDQARATLAAAVPGSKVDSTDPADGAPDDFVRLAARGLGVLGLLDTGTLRFDGSNWSIEGAVDSAGKGFAADAAYSGSGLKNAGWTYAVQEPALPAVTPYVWHAVKSSGGTVSVSGYVPDEALRQSLESQLGASDDTLALATGAPADFAANLAAGLEALGALDEGSLDLNGSTWTISGSVPDAAAREQIDSRLSGRVDRANWQVAIQARDAAPVVSPYLWSATRTSDGSISVTGYVPSATLKSEVLARAGNVGSDTSSIAAGAPQDFAEDLLAGLAALAHLTDGRAMFDGSTWTLVGDVSGQAQGQAAAAELALAPAAGHHWSISLNGYVAPAAPPSAPDVTSVAPPSSESAAAAASVPSSGPAAPPSQEQSSVASDMSEASSFAASSAPSSSSAEPSSVLPSSEPSSAEPASSSSAPSSTEPPASSSVEPPPPALPDQLSFEAALGADGIVLSGTVPTADDAAALAKAAKASADGLSVADGLPPSFTADATAGIAALSQLADGRLGFDGAKWWLVGKAETAAIRDSVAASISALPDGAGWTVAIALLPPLDVCRDRVAALQKKNAIQFSSRATFAKGVDGVIDQLAADLAICPDTDVHVQAHTDSDGSAELNLGISVARAEAVIDALVKRGADESRFYAEGFGESDPIASNDTKAGKAANRRITFEIDPR